MVNDEIRVHDIELHDEHDDELIVAVVEKDVILMVIHEVHEVMVYVYVHSELISDLLVDDEVVLVLEVHIELEEHDDEVSDDDKVLHQLHEVAVVLDDEEVVDV